MPAKSHSGSKLIFREDFRTQKTVADNGGIVTGTPIIKNGTSVLNDTNYIRFDKYVQVIRNNKSNLTIGIKAVLPVASAAYQSLFALRDAAGITFDLYLEGATNKPGFYNGTTLYKATNAVSAGEQWIFFTFSATTVSYYYVVNGVVTANGTSTATIGTALAAALYLGRSYVSSQPSNAQFKELIIAASVMSIPEMQDIVEADTYAELDDARALISLPLKTSYYEANGTNLNTAMTAAGFSSGNGGILSNPSADILRITNRGDLFSGFAHKALMTVNKRYRVTVEGRSDGRTMPALYDMSGNKTLAVGTTSTDWQTLCGETVAGGAGIAVLDGSGGPVNSNYVEFRNFDVQLMENRLENKGTLGSYVLLGDGSTLTTMPTFVNPCGIQTDGGDYLDLGSAINTYLTKDNAFTVIVYGVNKGMGAATHLFSNQDSSDRGFAIINFSEMVGLYFYDGASNYFGRLATLSEMGTVKVMAFTYNGNGSNTGIMIYKNGESIGGSATSAGAVVNTVSTMNFNWGRRPTNTQFALPHKDYAFAIYPFVLSPTQIKVLGEKMIKNKNL
jgi:hypothetical protein